VKISDYLTVAGGQADGSFDTLACWNRLTEYPWGPRGLERPRNWSENLDTLAAIIRAGWGRIVRRHREDHNWTVCDSYLKLLRPTFIWFGKNLMQVSFDLYPTYAEGSDRVPFKWSDVKDHPEYLWDNDAEGFWQIAFFSLFTEIGPVLCQTCGKELGETTPKKRRKTQRQCNTCRHLKWRKRRTKTFLQKMEHDSYIRWKQERAR